MLEEKYPYLSSSKGLLAAAGGFSAVGQAELDNAVSRILSIMAAADDPAATSLEPPASSARQSVQSYALCRLLLSIIANDYHWNKFAKGEAARAAHLLGKAPSDLADVGVDFFPTMELLPNGGYSVSLAELLNSGANKITQYELYRGRVMLNQLQLIEAIRRGVFRKARAPAPLPAQLPDSFKAAAESLLSRLPKPAVDSNYSGTHLTLPCIAKILLGVGEGRRYYASMSLAIACKKDNLSFEKALGVMSQFVVASAAKAANPFTEREANATLSWVYKRDPHFSCKYQREHGFADMEMCRGCPLFRNRRASFDARKAAGANTAAPQKGAA